MPQPAVQCSMGRVRPARLGHRRPVCVRREQAVHRLRVPRAVSTPRGRGVERGAAPLQLGVHWGALGCGWGAVGVRSGWEGGGGRWRERRETRGRVEGGSERWWDGCGGRRVGAGRAWLRWELTTTRDFAPLRRRSSRRSRLPFSGGPRAPRRGCPRLRTTPAAPSRRRHSPEKTLRRAPRSLPAAASGSGGGELVQSEAGSFLWSAVSGSGREWCAAVHRRAALCEVGRAAGV